MALENNPKMGDYNIVICMHASHKFCFTKKVWEEAFQQARGMKQRKSKRDFLAYYRLICHIIAAHDDPMTMATPQISGNRTRVKQAMNAFKRENIEK